VDVGRAFGFVFQDPRWVSKIAIGGLLLLVPIFGWFVIYGYSLSVARRVASEGTDLPLPEWESLGQLFVEGFRGFAVGFVWTLPVTIISLLISAATGGFDSDGSGEGLGGCITAPLSIAVAFFIPAAVTRAAVEQRFGAGLEFSRVFEIVRGRFGDYLMVFLISILAAIVGSLGLIGLCIGILFTIFYSTLITSHAYGQAYYRATGGSIAPVAPAPRF
jgi:hypothetical protein